MSVDTASKLRGEHFVVKVATTTGSSDRNRFTFFGAYLHWLKALLFQKNLKGFSYQMQQLPFSQICP